jgi:hypothetical protein
MEKSDIGFAPRIEQNIGKSSEEMKVVQEMEQDELLTQIQRELLKRRQDLDYVLERAQIGLEICNIARLLDYSMNEENRVIVRMLSEVFTQQIQLGIPF